MTEEIQVYLSIEKRVYQKLKMPINSFVLENNF